MVLRTPKAADGGAPGTLFVVSTPIGNMEDITLRALKVLGAVKVIAAEDTRVTHKLLSRHAIATPLFSVREQNAARAIPELVRRLQGGEDVAVVTDAGTPGVSDPGVELVAAAAEAGITVSPVPGPSALCAALSVAGLAGEGVRFVGFLPRAGRRRRERIAALVQDPSVIVLYEAPSRLAETLAELGRELGPRRAVVLRELTKLHEEVARGELQELAARFSGQVLGEVTLVVAGAAFAAANEGEAPDDDALRELVAREIAAGRSARDVSLSLSRAFGVPRRKVYDLAVQALKRP